MKTTAPWSSVGADEGQPSNQITGNSITDNSAASADEVLRKALSCRNGAAFKALWEGSTAGYPSSSEADYALCRQLTFWTGRDAGKMDAMFRQSGLMRDKWDRRQGGSTYGQITIQQAIDNCTEVYRPKRTNSMETQAVSCAAPSVKQAAPQFPPVKPLTPQWSELPPFPVDVLPQPLRDYVNAVAEHSQTSPDMAAVIGLGVLAVCLQGKFKVQGNPGYCEPLSLYTVVIAAPGERKSGVMRAMTRPLYDYEQEYNCAHSAEVRANRLERERLQRQISGLRRGRIPPRRAHGMKTAMEVKHSTLHDIFLYLRHFHLYLKRESISAPDAEGIFSYTIHREMPIQGYITDEELRKILSVIDTTTESGCRNMAIILLAVTTGIRACDVIRLKLKDIDWRKGEISFSQDKTDNATSIADMLILYQQKAGVERKPFDGKGFHGLRRHLAKSLLDTGTPPETIAQIPGHSQVQSVQQYLVLNTKQLKNCAIDFSGIEVERSELL